MKALLAALLGGLLVAFGLGSGAAIWAYDRSPGLRLHLAIFGLTLFDWTPPRAFQSAYAVGRADQLADDVRGAANAVQRQAKASQQIAAKDQAAQVHIQVVTHTLIQRVPVYVTPQADDRCVIPRGFVRLHDEAASGVTATSDRAGNPDAGAADAVAAANDADSGLKLSTVGQTVTENYGRCLAIRQQLLDLQDWERQRQAIASR